MAEKMTNAKALTFVLENFDGMPDEVREKVEKMLEQTLKKNAGNGEKATAKSLENQKYGEILLDFMAENTVYTITELLHKVDEFSGLSTSKVTAILKPLKEQGLVKRTESKGKVYWERV